MPTNDERGFISWKGCEAGAIIVLDFQNGELPLTEKEMSAEDAWKFKYSTKIAFKHVPFIQFKKQPIDHRKQVEKDNANLSAALKAFEHDQALFPRRRTHNRKGELVFDVHPAKEKLREDVENKVHKPLSPSEFRLTRPEYQCFTLDVFRDRIYQEIRLQRFYNYLEMQRKAKEKDKAKRWATQRVKLDKKAALKKKQDDKMEAQLRAKWQKEMKDQMDCS